jgi:hypothetical protein
LVDGLLDAFREIRENLYLGKDEPAELNAAKLTEFVIRILEHETTGSYTAVGVRIVNVAERLRQFENCTQSNDSIRFHIPRVASAVYNIRNKRGVGHVGGDVNPNLADSTFVAVASDWILAELIRLHYSCSLEDAQRWVDGLVQRRLFLVYEIDGRKRVLNPSLGFPTRVLLLLASEFPNGIEDRTLFDWTEHSNFAVFRRDVLQSLHRRRLIEYSAPRCTALPPGLKLVEENYGDWVDYSPQIASVRKRKKRTGN